MLLFHSPAAFWHRPRQGAARNGPVLLAERPIGIRSWWLGLELNQSRAFIGARKLRSIMPFSIPMAAAIYLTIWFTVLFAVLPFGVRSQHESGDFVPGTDPGAPVAPRLLAKAIWTTLISVASPHTPANHPLTHSLLTLRNDEATPTSSLAWSLAWPYGSA
jgi:predicted secreted protein